MDFKHLPPRQMLWKYTHQWCLKATLKCLSLTSTKPQRQPINHKVGIRHTGQVHPSYNVISFANVAEWEILGRPPIFSLRHRDIISEIIRGNKYRIALNYLSSLYSGNKILLNHSSRNCGKNYKWLTLEQSLVYVWPLFKKKNHLEISPGLIEQKRPLRKFWWGI